MYILRCTINTLLFTEHFLLYTETLYILHCTFYTVHCTFFILYCTLYIVHCTLYIVQYIVHCTLIIVLILQSKGSCLFALLPKTAVHFVCIPKAIVCMGIIIMTSSKPMPSVWPVKDKYLGLSPTSEIYKKCFLKNNKIIQFYV